MSLATAYLLPNRTPNINGLWSLAASAALVLDIRLEIACLPRFARQVLHLKEVFIDTHILPPERSWSLRGVRVVYGPN